MNAYELADVLESMADFDECEYQQSANMLRQQAQAIATLSDRIAELKHMNKNWQLSETMAYNRIAELEKDLEGCEYFLNKTQRIKELSDSEISEISHRYHYTYNPDYVGFARAILKKASEK